MLEDYTPEWTQHDSEIIADYKKRKKEGKILEFVIKD